MRGIHWFRTDLRLQDNTALNALAERVEQWVPVFVLDPRIEGGAAAGGARMRFLLDCRARLGRELDKRGVPLLVRRGRPEQILPRLLDETGARLLSFNEDTTPFALRRDAAVQRAVEKCGARVLSCVDDVVFRAADVRTASGGSYSVYSPYRRQWWKRWYEDPQGFEAWCEGRTGYPIVDAGMRQLRATGWMHNRVRMIVASFLTKDLLIDWRAGERFFFERLVDGDPASNNGGWQWAASTGTDAQPYFRIFNPVLQGRRWDPEGRYVKRWLPELSNVPEARVHAPWEAGSSADYPPPIVDHAERRELALERFGAARASRNRS